MPTNFCVGLQCRCIGQTPCSLEHYLVIYIFTEHQTTHTSSTIWQWLWPVTSPWHLRVTDSRLQQTVLFMQAISCH